jgi:dolichol-phosphate mannosyltransferase
MFSKLSIFVNQPIYSLVIPIYNEEENISEMYSYLINVMGELDSYAELTLIDYGRGDDSLSMFH